jgi:predicted ATPase
MKLTQLHIEGYRSLVNVTLPLRPLTVMIGPNGAGKTSLLEVFELLREAAQANLAKALEKLGGLNTVLSRTKPNQSERLKISLEIDFENPVITSPMIYQFELLPHQIGYEISSEKLNWQSDSTSSAYYSYDWSGTNYRLFFQTEGVIDPHLKYEVTEVILAQLPQSHVESYTLRVLLSKTRKYSILDVEPRSFVRLPQSLTPALTPGPNGENLYSALYNLRTSYPDIYDRLTDILRLAFPQFDRLELPLVGAGQATMIWYQTDLTGPLYPNELSEGTLRFLWLVTTLLSPAPSPITLIDEPEVSLHPELLKLLAGLLQDASVRTQLIVATQSADLVRWLQPEEVLVLDKVEGQTHFTWADSLNLEAWLKEYTLGELWLMGTLGGRP